jgi:hypothetical protein
MVTYVTTLQMLANTHVHINTHILVCTHFCCSILKGIGSDGRRLSAASNDALQKLLACESKFTKFRETCDEAIRKIDLGGFKSAIEVGELLPIVLADYVEFIYFCTHRPDS